MHPRKGLRPANVNTLRERASVPAQKRNRPVRSNSRTLLSPSSTSRSLSQLGDEDRPEEWKSGRPLRVPYSPDLRTRPNTAPHLHAHLAHADMTIQDCKLLAEACAKNGKPRMEGHAYYHLGGLYVKERNQRREAITYFKKYLDICDRLGDLQGKAKALNTIGLEFQEIGGEHNYTTALAYHRQHLDISEGATGLFIANTNIGLLHSELSNHEEAKKYFSEAVRGSVVMNNKHASDVAIANLLHAARQIASPLRDGRAAGGTTGVHSPESPIGWMQANVDENYLAEEDTSSMLQRFQREAQSPQRANCSNFHQHSFKHISSHQDDFESWTSHSHLHSHSHYRHSSPQDRERGRDREGDRSDRPASVTPTMRRTPTVSPTFETSVPAIPPHQRRPSGQWAKHQHTGDLPRTSPSPPPPPPSPPPPPPPQSPPSPSPMGNQRAPSPALPPPPPSSSTVTLAANCDSSESPKPTATRRTPLATQQPQTHLHSYTHEETGETVVHSSITRHYDELSPRQYIFDPRQRSNRKSHNNKGQGATYSVEWEPSPRQHPNDYVEQDLRTYTHCDPPPPATVSTNCDDHNHMTSIYRAQEHAHKSSIGAEEGSGHRDPSSSSSSKLHHAPSHHNNMCGQADCASETGSCTNNLGNACSPSSASLCNTTHPHITSTLLGATNVSLLNSTANTMSVMGDEVSSNAPSMVAGRDIGDRDNFQGPPAARANPRHCNVRQSSSSATSSSSSSSSSSSCNHDSDKRNTLATIMSSSTYNVPLLLDMDQHALLGLQGNGARQSTASLASSVLPQQSTLNNSNGSHLHGTDLTRYLRDERDNTTTGGYSISPLDNQSTCTQPQQPQQPQQPHQQHTADVTESNHNMVTSISNNTIASQGTVIHNSYHSQQQQQQQQQELLQPLPSHHTNSKGQCNTQHQQQQQAYVVDLIEDGKLKFKHKEFDAAHKLFNDALRIAKHNDWFSIQGNAMRNLGVVYAQTGHREQAIQLYDKGLGVARTHHDNVGQAAALLNLGCTYHELNAFEQAKVHYKLATKLSRLQNDSRTQGAAAENLRKLSLDACGLSSKTTVV